MADFTADNIRSVNIIFTPGEEFENLIAKAEFNVVASRAAQAATLKAEKASDCTVDLAAAKAASKGNTNNEDNVSEGGGTDNDGEKPPLGGD